MISNEESSDTFRLNVKDPAALLLRDLVHERTGVFFETDHLDLMADKLEPRARATGCRTYLDYYYLLKYDEHGFAEWRRVMDAISVQETYFWREIDQVRALVDQFVPAHFKASSRPLRIWSAACASGEEPYTMAIALEEAGWGGHPIEILATDASESAIARAKGRVFRERSFRSLPLALREKYFERSAEGFHLRSDLAARITFEWANLLDVETMAGAAGADVIFCRNVFIYFSPEAIKRVLASFAILLPAGGPLFVGASESLLRLTDRFELEKAGAAFVYRRKTVS